MDDIKLAMLGDKEAAKRLTDAGVLLLCPKCGRPGEVYEYPGEDWSQPYTAKCKKNDCFWIGKDYPTKKQAIREWNTRAPVLTAEEMEMLEVGDAGGITGCLRSAKDANTGGKYKVCGSTISAS